jgi:DNA-nicking Smr family endonuclease
MPAAPKPNSRDIILQYLDRYGIRDKDLSNPAPGKSVSTRINAKRAKRGRRVIDLHGLRVDTAVAALRDALDSCTAAGASELLVIHGYGLHSKPGEGGALKTAVRQYLDEACDVEKIRSFVIAAPKDGGEGATVVKIR